MPAFRPAAGLCADLHRQVLAPALAGVPHAAALLGPGSDVLGFDTERSTDHDWGPRACVFVDPADVGRARELVAAAVPAEFGGWPLRIGRDGGPLEHRVLVDTWPGWLRATLGVDATGDLDVVDWLLLPQQRLLEVVAGPVFADPRGELAAVRTRLAWYPDDVWWWLLACQWRRLAQEEAFVQRTAEVGDELGSAVLAARQVREAVRLALLMARRYAPYAKWLGSAFARLAHPDGLDRSLRAALGAGDLVARERALVAASEALARRHAELPGATALDPRARRFHDRPALVLGADRFAADCLARVRDERLLGLPLIGSVDQVADSTDLLVRPDLLRRLRALYAGGAGP
ncbi:DUF4037 domain-containing protein [Kineococcus glutinatus]|uniref:DUF4037 domain-containing protein n=1 Tax=Kineococcus glutinatus TaxID=1070872 RepID=A0ABP9HU05_9ACTN